jgi:NAD(P)-dependent dehydrogenase (short-subunit alcohol dehydrogenase family)
MASTSDRPVAIITGGTRGIGSGIASALADDGFDLLLTYNSNLGAARDFVATLKAQRPSIQCALVGGDLAESKTRDAIFECYDQEFNGRTLGAVVHNAGQYVGITSTNESGLGPQNIAFGNNSILGEDGKPQLEPMKFYQALYGDAYIDLCERGIARMGSAGGSLIGISSPGCNLSYRPGPNYSLPGSGKCIMEYANRIIAVTAAEKNINSNVIVPGVTLSEAWSKCAAHFGSKSAKEMTDRVVENLVPMKRPIEVRGIGDVASFLCSSKGRYITGVSLPVDGGLHLK